MNTPEASVLLFSYSHYHGVSWTINSRSLGSRDRIDSVSFQASWVKDWFCLFVCFCKGLKNIAPLAPENNLIAIVLAFLHPLSYKPLFIEVLLAQTLQVWEITLTPISKSFLFASFKILLYSKLVLIKMIIFWLDHLFLEYNKSFQ